MRLGDLKLTKKGLDFLGTEAIIEILEGTTLAGKTTLAGFKLIKLVMESTYADHLLSGVDVGVVEANVITCDMGILDIFGSSVTYHRKGGAGKTVTHISVMGLDKKMKSIRVVGYSTKEKWTKVLGAHVGVHFIDEIDRCHPDFVETALGRAYKMIATLNPNRPDLPLYDMLINRARPLPKYIDTVPKSILRALLNCPAMKGYVYWFFHHSDNIGLPIEHKRRLLNNYISGTTAHKSRVLGLRVRAEDLIWGTFVWDSIVVTDVTMYKFVKFSIGIDTSYSMKTADSISLLGVGITKCGKVIPLMEQEFNNRDLSVANRISPSDMPLIIVKFFNELKAQYGLSEAAWIDSSDAATLAECYKYASRTALLFTIVSSYKRAKLAKTKTGRVELLTGWMNQGNFLIHRKCVKLLYEMQNYAWATGDDRVPQDGNDHFIDALSYGFLPYIYLTAHKGDANDV